MAVDLLTKCVDCVDPGQADDQQGGDLSEEFTAAQSNLTQAYASLRAYVSNRHIIAILVRSSKFSPNYDIFSATATISAKLILLKLTN